VRTPFIEIKWTRGILVRHIVDEIKRGILVRHTADEIKQGLAKPKPRFIKRD